MMINWRDFDYSIIKNCKLQKLKRGNRGKKNPIRYKNIVTAFDIETTTLPDYSVNFMYIWQWQIGLECTVIGRTWDDFRMFSHNIANCMDAGESLVVLIHNASYEFQYLKSVYHFDNKEVFAMDTRKILKFSMYDKRLEFRDTYIHSNMSLKQYLRKFNVVHQKIDGEEFDYTIQRYPWTELTPLELEYCQNDVLGLVEAYTEEMRIDGDNISSIPLTSTGYVRRDCKRAMRNAGRFIQSLLPDYEVYKMLESAFRGGNTHANRYLSNFVIDSKDVGMIHSYDRSSSYPDVLLNRKFPMKAFKPLKDATMESCTKWIEEGYAFVMELTLFNVDLNDSHWGCPYLSKDKCTNIIGGVFDNGRILKAEQLTTTITDVDLEIIAFEYKWSNSVIHRAFYSKYERLPMALRMTIIDYYRRKTRLKDVEGQEVMYAKSKALLNGIYGCFAEKSIRIPLEFDGIAFHDAEEVDEQEILLKHNKKAWTSYAVGVWCTAWARYELERGMIEVYNQAGADAFIYTDTDSIKFKGEVDFTELNKTYIEASINSGSFADDPKGKRHYMGVYEQESDYTKFVTMGAKKYAYQYEDGKTHCTVSGVNKKKGGAELDKYNGIYSFKEGFTFYDAGGTESVYNDLEQPYSMTIDGHKVEITSNVVIKNSTYTLGLTEEYKKILNNSALYIDIMRKSEL